MLDKCVKSEKKNFVYCKNTGATFCIEPEKRQSTFLGPLE